MTVRAALLATALACVGNAAWSQSQPAVPCGGGQSCAAIRAADYLDSIGVNTHVNMPNPDPYGEAANAGPGYPVTTGNGTSTSVFNIVKALQFTGIGVMRDTVNYTYVVGRFQAIQQAIARMKLILITTDVNNTILDHINPPQPIWGSIVALEGLNEARDNAAYFPYNGLSGSAGVCAWQKDMYNALQTANSQRGTTIPFLAASVADHAQFQEMANDAACVAAANASNGHSYVDTNPPTPGILAYASQVQSNAPAGAPNWVTETGVTSNPYLGGNGCGNGADQHSQAIVNLEIALGFKRLGVARTVLYELADDPTNDPTPGANSCQREPHFGMYDFNWNPKEEAYAFHNQLTVVGDSDANARSFTTAPLAYTITGAPANTYSLLMQQASGTWVAAIWPENPVWNYASGGNIGTRVAAATFNATVTYPAMTAVTLYDPFGSGTTMTSTNVGAGSSATVPLTDHPVFLVMSGTAAPPPTGGIGVCTFSGGTL